MRVIRGILIALAICALAGGALAGDTNWWTGASDNNYTNPANWSLGIVPTTNEAAFFTNAGPTTIQFTSSTTNSLLHIGASNVAMDVTFDLNGNQWRNATPLPLGAWPGRQGVFDQAGETGVVTFSSSSSPAFGGGNVVELQSAYNTAGNYGFGPYGVGDQRHSVINVNASLGFPVVVKTTGVVYYMSGHSYMTINVDGPGAEFRTASNSDGGFSTRVNVTNGGLFSYGGTRGLGSYGGLDGYWFINDGTLLTPSSGFNVGWGYAGILNVSNSVWTANGVTIGPNKLYGSYPWNGDVTVRDSTVTANSMIIGNGGTGNGILRLYDSAMTVSNGLLRVNSQTGASAYTNTLMIANSTINLGPVGPGILTNRGILRANGTITSLGATGLLRNERLLDVGNSIGTLTLSNMNLELAAGSLNQFEFSETGLDQIIVDGGYASVVGSNVYTLVGTPPAPGVKWGLGAYDFIVGTNVTWNPQFDNLTNILASYSLVEGIDYSFGVAYLGDGSQALRLQFIPEPSTVLLLAGGGLLLWRSRRKRQG